MQVLVIEDEAIITRRIVRLLQELDELRFGRIRTAATYHEALDDLQQHPVDLVFLDLNLNGRDGFDILKQAVAASFHTVVISAHTERALEAFEFGVLDFIGKPFNRERLAKALARVKTQNQGGSLQQLAVRKNSGLVLIALDEVRYIKGANTYSELVLKDGRVELHAKSLDKLKALLPRRYQRIHKSYIVDMETVMRLCAHEGSRYELELNDGTVLPVGRTRYKDLKQRFA